MRKEIESNNKATLFINKDIFSFDVIKRALFSYVDDIFTDIDDSNTEWKISLELKNKDEDINKIIKAISNSFIEEDVRYQIENETSSIRDALYLKAMDTASSNNLEEE